MNLLQGIKLLYYGGQYDDVITLLVDKYRDNFDYYYYYILSHIHYKINKSGMLVNITLLIIYKMINLRPFGIGFVPTYDCDS